MALCLQDTTELNFNGQATAELGPLSPEAQRGMHLYPTFPVTTAREPLGVLDAWMWARQSKARWHAPRDQGGLPCRGAATVDHEAHRARPALFPVVAWCIARLIRLGHTLPDLDAALPLEPAEGQAAYILAKKPPPKQPPRRNAVLRLIARLGGFLGRKGDGDPGVKTISLGLQRVWDFAAVITFAKATHGL